MKKLVIERSALKSNLAAIKAAAGRSAIYANLSRDACGAGAVPLALFLREEGISRFAVDNADTAAALRGAGLVEEEILMIRSTSDRRELETLLEHNIICSLGSLEAGMALNALAAERATVAEAHLQIDCGTGFGGFPCEEPDKMASIYQNLGSVAISGAYTHLRSDPRSLSAQLEAFTRALDHLRQEGYETGTVHAAGSYALLHQDTSRLDAVRAGSALLGRCRRVRGDGLRAVGFGEAALTDLRWLPKGHTIGRRALKTLRRPTRVATIPVGYHNGLGMAPPPNSLLEAVAAFFRFRRPAVWVGGQRVRVLGRVGATETLLDVTDLRCAEGDTVTFELDPRFARGLKREYR